MKNCCQGCGKEISKTAKHCKPCRAHLFDTAIDRNTKLVSMLKQNKYSFKELARYFGITKQRVDQIQKKYLKEKYKKHFKKNKSILKRNEKILKDLELKFYTFEELAKKYKVTKEIVSGIFYQNHPGIGYNVPNLKIQRTIELIEMENTHSQIGRMVGYPPNNVLRIFKKYVKK